MNVKGAAFTHRAQKNLCPTGSQKLLTQEKSHGDAEEGDAGGLRAEQAAPSDQAGPDDGDRPLAQPPADHGHQWGWKGKGRKLGLKMMNDALQGSGTCVGVIASGALASGPCATLGGKG